MAQEQQAPAKPSLITRVFGSRIGQALGIFGVAFSLFQGLEPFLKFSRFMAYLVNHWRELTRGLWSWLASFVHLDLPEWAWDLTTLILFIVLFTVRGIKAGMGWQDYGTKSIFVKLNEPLLIHGKRALKSLLSKYIQARMPRVAIVMNLAIFLISLMITTSVLLVAILVIPMAVFVTLFIHLHIWQALIAAVTATVIYSLIIFISFPPTRPGKPYFGIYINSERTIFVLIGLLAINYIALHSHSIEAFIKKATQPVTQAISLG